MKIPMSWLDDYTSLGVGAKEYSDGMTMSGSKVESFESAGDEIDKVVVGKITEINKHPDADKLVVCQVDVGDKTVQIVTGAPNVFEGASVPVALHGARLPGGVTIKKGKLRGVMSEGMMCSTDELGMSEERADGILILDGEPAPGQDIRDVLGLNEVVVDFDITSNRPDCLSVIGLARESAATFGKPFSIPTVTVEENSQDVKDYVSVTVQEPVLCPRYSARVVKNIKIGPSPKWLQDRLHACGVRAINNIVDITNYVMLEYGQPMHAFDINFLSNQKIIVRCARPQERIVTLDSVERVLDENMLVICDDAKPVAVAGVMGGENSEINENTKTIVFESANFLGTSVRTTAKTLGMRTESSSRYEKELDPGMTVDAVNRACQLINQLGAGEVVGGVIDICSDLDSAHTISLRPDKINTFLGTSIPKEEMISILEQIEFSVEGDIITVPSFRRDVVTEADVAEEIARFYGYNKIESTLMRGETVMGGKTKEQRTEDAVKAVLVGQGLYEIYTYTFTDPKSFDRLNIPADDPLRKAVPISNPLGEEQSIMRTNTMNEMLRALSLNYSHRNQNVSLFEIGKVYVSKSLPVAELPEERQMVTIGMYGNDTDFYELKGIIEQLLQALNIRKYKVESSTENKTFHPGRTAKLTINGEYAGIFGQVHYCVTQNYEIDLPVYLAALEFDTLFRYQRPEKSYQALPKYPAVTRDIAMLCDDTIEVGQIEEVIKKCSGELLEELQLFDVYKGKQIPHGKKSVAYSVLFRDKSKTLEESEVNAVMERILTELETRLHAELRKN